MSKHEFKEGQVLGVITDKEGLLDVVKVEHQTVRGGKIEQFRSGNTYYGSKLSLPMNGKGIQYTFPGLKKELSDNL